MCCLLAVAAIGCRGREGVSSAPEPQPDTATDVASETRPKPGQDLSGLPVDTPDAIREAVEMVVACGELENLVPVMTAWDQLCQHATASGAEVAAQRIEACRAELLARKRAAHPAPPGEPVVEGRGSEAYEAGLRDALVGAKYEFREPLSLDACAPASL